MSTALDIVSEALRTIGVLAMGEVASDDMAQQALGNLNRMLQGWNISRMMVPVERRETFALVIGQQSYTMGSGANFNTTRPNRIDRAELYDATLKLTLPITLVDDRQFSAVQLKELQTPYPRYVWIQGGSGQTITLWLWPVPSAVHSLVLYSWGPFTAFSSLSASVTWPDGYEDAAVYGLAERLCLTYARPVPPLLLSKRMEAEARVKALNGGRAPALTADVALRRGGGNFNIYSGDNQ